MASITSPIHVATPETEANVPPRQGLFVDKEKYVVTRCGMRKKQQDAWFAQNIAESLSAAERLNMRVCKECLATYERGEILGTKLNVLS